MVGGPKSLFVILFAIVCTTLQVFVQYSRYVAVLKWTTLSLFAYFGTVLVVDVPWGEVARGLFIPRFTAQFDFWTMVVAIFGTTISPYLFFWQASEEVEDIADVAAHPDCQGSNMSVHCWGASAKFQNFTSASGLKVTYLNPTPYMEA